MSLYESSMKFLHLCSTSDQQYRQQEQTAQPDELEAAIAGTEQDRLGSAWLVIDCDRAGVRYGRGTVGTSKGYNDII